MSDAQANGLPSRATPYEQLPEFLSPEEFGAYLVLSRNTTYELLRRGEVPHRRFGRAIRIPKTALLLDTANGHVR
jgi:excisionase family DNA binding protein